MAKRVETLKDLDKKLAKSFTAVKSDQANLIKSRNAFSNELVKFNTRIIKIEDDYLKSNAIHNVKLQVDKIEHEQKKLNDTYTIMKQLKKDTALKKDVDARMKSLEKENAALRKEVEKIKHSKDMMRLSHLRELEASIVKQKDLRNDVLDDISEKYSDNKQVTAKHNALRKEYLGLESNMGKVKKEVLDFQKTNLVANVFFVVAVISIVGAAIALKMSYLSAANFLGLEAFVFLVMGLLLKLFVFIRR